MVLPNGTITTINQIILQRITEVYPDNTIEINETIYDVNQRYYLPPSMLGKNVTIGEVELYFVNYSIWNI